MTLPPAAPDLAAAARHGNGSADGRDGASFRDPSGFVYWRDGQPYRQIQATFATEWDAFEASPLKRRLLDQGRLIPYEPVGHDLASTPDAYAVIRPERIDFISYPYEWSFSQLKDAALLTLELQSRALDAGMRLKDASAYNIQFQSGRPVLIDTLSFEPRGLGFPLSGHVAVRLPKPVELPQKAGRRTTRTLEWDVRHGTILRLEQLLAVAGIPHGRGGDRPDGLRGHRRLRHAHRTAAP